MLCGARGEIPVLDPWGAGCESEEESSGEQLPANKQLVMSSSHYSARVRDLLSAPTPFLAAPAPALSTRAFVNLVCRLFRSLRCRRT